MRNRNNIDNNFPFKFSILSLALFSILYIVGPAVIKAVSGTVNMYFIIFESFGILFRILAICLLGSFILILHKLLKRIIKSKTTWAILSLLPVILLSARSVYYSLPSVRAERILTNADLAPLPQSATELKVFTWSTPFSGRWFLKFRANANDIEQFLKASSIPEQAESQESSEGRVIITRSNGQLEIKKLNQVFPNYIKKHDPITPPWYMEEINKTAKRYIIRPQGYNHDGEVIVDEEKNLIFVKLKHD